MKNESSKFSVDIGKNLCITLCVVMASVSIASVIVGGCAVNGYFKTEAVRAMNPEKQKLFDPHAIGHWEIVNKK